MAEEEVIRKRLAVEGEGGGDDRRVMSLLKTFARWCSGQTADEGSEATYQKMLFTLGQCEFSSTKTEMVMEMNRREMERYEQVYSDIESRIEEAKQQLASYREELQQSRVIRRHCQEYDTLAKVIQQHPPRQESHDKIAELQTRLQTLHENGESLDSKLELRRKQLCLLVYSIHQMQETLSKEEGEESAVSMDTS